MNNDQNPKKELMLIFLRGVMVGAALSAAIVYFVFFVL